MEHQVGRPELFEAIEKGYADRAREILAETPALAGARNEQGVSALMIALYHRQPELARVILEAGNPDAFEAAALGDVEMMQAWLDSDPAVLAARSADGFTLLHLACFFNHPEASNRLIERGADVNAIADNPSRVTPLHSAAACSSTEIVSILLEAGANPDAAQHGGYTALQSAAMHGNEAMLNILLDHGASADLVAEDDRTALEMASEAGHEAVAQRLARLRNPETPP